MVNSDYRCSNCRSAEDHDYYLRTRDKRLEVANHWYQNHRDQKIEYLKVYHKLHSAKEVASAKNRNNLARAAFFDHYGWKCAMCKETNQLFLTGDHINNDGHMWRKANPTKAGNYIYRWARANGWPNTLQTLCYNCQIVKEIARKRDKALENHPLPPNAKYCANRPQHGFCANCGIELNSQTAGASSVKRGRGRCFVCNSKYGIMQHDLKKRLVMEHYGGKCYCCGENRLERLSLGHPNNDGNKHRAESSSPNKGSGINFYHILLKANFSTPYKLRVECFNCNCGAAHNNGICPHNTNL